MSLLQRRIAQHRNESTRKPRRDFRPSMRAAVENLESRLVLSAPAAVAPVIQPAINILPQLDVTNVVKAADGTLEAIVSLGNQTTAVPLSLSASPNTPGASCPILSLHLDEIHLDLLGLNVDTSKICLDITAYDGGGLLGDLLCNVSTLLEGGTSLGDILNGLTSVDPGSLLTGLTDVLNSALGALTTTSATPTATQPTPSVGGTSPGACDILDLSLGPVDLTLLGLNVHLDNCDNNPVTVDITAVPGDGLLGDLLCSVDNLLSNGHASTRAIDRLLTNVAKDIQSLL